MQICFPKVLNIEYFQNISLHYMDGIGRELGFVCHQTPKKQLYENGMPKKGLDGALSTTKH